MSYVGPWPPEPLLTAPDVAEDVELAESVSTAMMLVLETLGPTERAVFVLREVFDLASDEIAGAVGRPRPRSARSPTGHGHMSPRADPTTSSPRPRPEPCSRSGHRLEQARR